MNDFNPVEPLSAVQRAGGAGPASSGEVSPLAPPRLDGYRTDRLLGRGGTASVWLIRATPGDAPFALKVLEGSGARGPARSDPQAARRELRILQRFEHEHLVRVHEVLPTDQGPALRMDYAAGDSLLRLVASRGPLSVGEVVTILTPVAQALAYLHREGAAHGDVSPGNILFTAQGKPMLADLGTGRLLGESVGGQRVGTPGFLASPRHDGVGRLDTEADVFALAAVGWFAVSGRVPGPAAQRPPLSVLVPDVPAELVRLIEAGLSEDPRQRPSAGEFAQSVLRTAAVVPVDLVASVHPSVLPELRTRRAVQEARRGSRTPDRGRTSFRRSSGRPLAGVIRRGRGTDSARGTHARVRHGAWTGAAGVLAVALVAGGVVVAGPGLWSAGSGALRPEPDAVTAGAPTALQTAPSSQTPQSSTATRPPASPPEPPAQSAQSAQDDDLDLADPLKVLPALARMRVKALSTADPAVLDLVNVERSPAMEQDLLVVDGLIERGQVFSGLSVALENLRESGLPSGTGASGGRTTAVAASSLTSGYEVRTVPGEVVRSEPGRTRQELIFVLREVDGRWKILAVHEAPS